MQVKTLTQIMDKILNSLRQSTSSNNSKKLMNDLYQFLYSNDKLINQLTCQSLYINTNDYYYHSENEVDVFIDHNDTNATTRHGTNVKSI